VRFLRELFFPAPAYMRQKYAHSAAGWLPWLYLRRAFGGFAKLLRWNHATTTVEVVRR
jgi:hypothetical protein